MRSHLGLCISTENQEFGEAEGDFVDFANFKFRDVVPVEVTVVRLGGFDDAHAQMAAYRCIKIARAKSVGDVF